MGLLGNIIFVYNPVGCCVTPPSFSSSSTLLLLFQSDGNLVTFSISYLKIVKPNTRSTHDGSHPSLDGISYPIVITRTFCFPPSIEDRYGWSWCNALSTKYMVMIVELDSLVVMDCNVDSEVSSCWMLIVLLS